MTKTKKQNTDVLYPEVISDKERACAWMNGAGLSRLYDLASTIRNPYCDVVPWTDLQGDEWNDELPMQRPTSPRECLYVYYFLDEFWRHFAPRKRALMQLHYQLGTTLGKRWATAFATEAELKQLKRTLPFEIEMLRGHSDSSYTPSHSLLDCIYDDEDLYKGPDGQADYHADIYYRFWSRLFPQPLTKANYSKVVTAAHPLKSAEFAAGFIDGATGSFDVAINELHELDILTGSHPV